MHVGGAIRQKIENQDVYIIIDGAHYMYCYRYCYQGHCHIGLTTVIN